MSQSAIRVENLSKLYRIGTRQNQVDTLREKLTHAIAHPFRHLFGRNGVERAASSVGQLTPDPCRLTSESVSQPSTLNPQPTSLPITDHRSPITDCSDTIWALKDVSFDVKPGEVVGIIGRNGAGKSTLLKILSRITEPTAGRVEIRGRVASLLEVGTGFHPELTGRENIYLNGNILGMTNREVARKFDEIVDFAEIEKFIDTPVKRYSSGMYVRLAFAIAAHIEPEILLVDEVLAVGDHAFRDRCLRSMNTLAKTGRTVVLVSHDITAIEHLSQRAIVLDQARLRYVGATQNAIAHYLAIDSHSSHRSLDVRRDRQGHGHWRLVSLASTGTHNVRAHVKIGDRLVFTIGYEGRCELRAPRFIIGVYDSINSPVLRFDTRVSPPTDTPWPSSGFITCRTDPIAIMQGRYTLNLALYESDEMQDYIQGAGSFEVLPTDYYGSGRLVESKLARILVKHVWKISNKGETEGL